MNDVNVDAPEQTIAKARQDPSAGAPAERLQELKRIADDQRSRVFCVSSPIVAGGASTSRCSSQRLVIVESVTKKRSAPGPAKDVYNSRLWTARRSYAEAAGVPWLILSALHGLLDPNQIIEPYELRLGETDAAAFRSATERAVAQLDSRWALDDLVVEAHVRDDYADGLRAALVRRGRRLEQPLRGLSVCGQLSWYRGENPSAADACSLADAT